MAGPGMWTGCGNNGCTNGVSWIPHWWIMRSWDVGAAVCCVWLESSTATHWNRVIDLVFDMLSHRTDQLTGSWIAPLCCRRHSHIKRQSCTHIYHGATSHTCSHDSYDGDRTSHWSWDTRISSSSRAHTCHFSRWEVTQTHTTAQKWIYIIQ